MKFLSFLRKKKRGERSLEDYLLIAKDEPENTGVHMKIADLYLKKGKKAEAIKEYLYSAEAYAKEELYQLTTSIYKTVLSLDPSSVKVYVTLAELYQKLGFIGDAAATYEKLAQHLFNSRKNEELRGVVEKMINLDPSNRFIRKKVDRFLGAIKGLPNNEEEFIVVGEKKQENIKGQAPEFVLGEKKYFDLGAKLDDGENILVSASRIEATNDDSSMDLNKVFEGIIKDIESKPKEEATRLHYELGIAYQQIDRIDEAIEEFKKALDDQEVKNDCFRRLAECFRDKEMHKHAINAAKSGLKSRFISQNEFLGLNYELGLTYAEMGEIEKAIEVFQEVKKVNINFKDTKKILEELMKG